MIQKNLKFFDKTYALPFISFDHFIIKHSILQKMASEHKKIKEFSDTSDSFCPHRQNESYPHPKEHQYKVIIENNAKAVSSLLEDSNLTKDVIEAVLNNFEKNINPILNDLLSETTQVRRKLRNEHDRYQSMMREQKSKLRKLSQENVSLTSELQILQQNNLEGSSKLKLKLRGQSCQNKELQKEIQGLQNLLSEYQKELEKKDQQIEKLKKQCAKNNSLYQQAKQEIINQVKQIEELKDINFEMVGALRNQELVLAKMDEERLQIIAEQEHLYRETLYHKNQELYYLASSEKEQTTKIKDMQKTIMEMKDELNKQKDRNKKIEAQARQDKSKIKTNTQQMLKSLQEKYEVKLKKMANLLRKELKRTNKQIQILKTIIPKQALIAFKQTKDIVLNHLYNY